MAKTSPGPEPAVLTAVLQSYEEVLDALERVTALSHELADLVSSGNASPGALADYKAQLRSVDQHVQVLRGTLLAFWRIVQRDKPNNDKPH